MNRFSFLIAPLLIILTNFSPVAAQAVHDVGDRAQLFIDQLIVRKAERVWFSQHQGKKHPQNPLITGDQPWEKPGWAALHGTVIFDEQEQVFKLWYGVLGDETNPGGDYGFDYETGYAYSRDGIHWTKPLVGTVQAKNGKPHNVVADARTAGVIKDLNDPDPNRRYKMVGFTEEPRPAHGIGYRTFVSPDGLHWKRVDVIAKKPHGDVGDVICTYWDSRMKRYVGFAKSHFEPWRGHTRRLFYTTTSKDFAHWTKPVLSWTTDARDDAGSAARLNRARRFLAGPDDPALVRTEFYGIGAYPAESVTIAFPWVFTVNSAGHDGPQEIQLAVSRDLLKWERPFRLPIIELSGDPNDWDGGYQSTACSAIRVKDEIWLYYEGGNWTHGSFRAPGKKRSIGLATWELDRFVSVDGPAEGGTLTTIPFKFQGDRLEINARTKPNGGIIVELLDAAGRPLKDYTASDKFEGNDLRHTVTFENNPNVAALQGKTISLRFRIWNAELFSFGFRGEG